MMRAFLLCAPLNHFERSSVSMVYRSTFCGLWLRQTLQ